MSDDTTIMLILSGLSDRLREEMYRYKYNNLTDFRSDLFRKYGNMLPRKVNMSYKKDNLGKKENSDTNSWNKSREQKYKKNIATNTQKKNEYKLNTISSIDDEEEKKMKLLMKKYINLEKKNKNIICLH